VRILTTQFIAEAQHDTSKILVYWDSVIRGFGVRLERSGRKVWIVRYKAYGKIRIMQIGSCGLMTIDEARKEATLVMMEVADGADPLARRNERRKIGLKRHNQPTFAEFSEIYINEYAKAHKKSWQQDQRWLRKYINPALGQKFLSEITRSDIAQFHVKIGREYPVLANRLCEVVSKIFSYARIHDYFDPNRPNPTAGIQQFKEVSRDRWLRPDELERINKSLIDEGDPQLRAYFSLILHTCLRRNELLKIQWSQIDFYSKLLTLPDSKSGRPHYLPLTKQALEIFSSIPRVENNPYVFCGKVAGASKVNVDKAWRRIRKRADLDDVTIHDLRRTGASILAQSGVSLALIGQILNQSNERVTAVYARFAKDNVRAAMDNNSAIIEAQLYNGAA
jgi:integrase